VIITIPAIITIGLVLGAIAYFAYRAVQRGPAAANKMVNEWLAEVLPVVSNPDTDPDILRMYLTMENPHDWGFYARLRMLRVLSQNPALSPELQAAAITRISQEEATARLDKSLRKQRGGVGGFVGVSVPI